MIRSFLMGVAVVAAAAAQPAAQPVAEPTEATLARTLTRQTLLDLRAIGRPGPDDYALAAALLRLAHELDPKQPDILRRAIEAERSVGNDRAVLDLTRDLYVLDPSDQVAGLRLVTAAITAFQSAEDRLAAYDKLIADARVDGAIRSRLALDAALLLRERGDNSGFVAKLKAAMSLDPTNKEAATLASAYVSDRVTDPRARVEMLTLVLMADPLDANVHMALARELAAAGAFKAARRFQRNAVEILTIALGNAGEQAVIHDKILQWYAEGPAAMVEGITKELSRQRDDVARELNRLKAAGQPTDRVKKPEDVRLNLPMTMLVVMGAQCAGDPAAATSFAADAAGVVSATLAALRDPVRRGEVTEQQATEASADLAIQIHTMRLWSGIQADDAVRDMRATQEIRRVRPEVTDLLEAFSRLRTGEPEVAVEQLGPAAERYPLASAGEALGLEALGRRDEAIAAYQRTVRLYPLDSAGVWAFAQLARLGVKPDAPLAVELERMASDVPAWIDRMPLRPQEFVSVTIEPVSRQTEALGPSTIRVTIQNLSQIPLGLGGDRPISSRLLFVPEIESRSTNLTEFAAPEVVDLNYRLRLMPRERLVADVWPDSGQCGWMMESLANRTLRVRWRVVQGFQPDDRGGFRPGVLGAYAEAPPMSRIAVEESALSPESLARRVATAPVTSITRLAAAARALVVQPILAPSLFDSSAPGLVTMSPATSALGTAARPTAEGMSAVVDAFIARYPNLPPVERATVAALLPHAKLAASMARFDALVRADGDPLVRCVALVTRVSEPTDELLARLVEAEDARVRTIAGLVKSRLASDAMVYSRLTLSAVSNAPATPPEPQK
ncbi:MAG: hypothetical protein JNM80_11720 [Phycisphaerae bacterium]|nr:hypothetical protein [Phycisphaerae bacterium]